MDLVIRAEQPADAQAIAAVVQQAFRAAPHASGTEAGIVRALRLAGALSLSLVAIDQDRIVGHVALSPVTISDGSQGWYGLGPVAVLPSLQGRGIGSRLVEQALQLLRARGAGGCVVLGEPGYYGRFGFRADPALVLEGVLPAYFQALSFTGASVRGTVHYHAAFTSSA